MLYTIQQYTDGTKWVVDTTRGIAYWGRERWSRIVTGRDVDLRVTQRGMGFAAPSPNARTYGLVTS